MIAVTVYGEWAAVDKATAGGLSDAPGDAALAMVVAVPVLAAGRGALVGRKRGKPVGRPGGLTAYLAGLHLLLGAMAAYLLWHLVLLAGMVMWAAG